MTIKTKLVLLAAIPLAVVGTGVIATALTVNRTNKEIGVCKNQYAAEIELARRMQLDVIQVQQFLTDYSATRGQDGLDDGLGEAAKYHDDFLASLKNFRTIATASQKDDGANELDRLTSAFEAYWITGNQMAQAYAKDGTTAGNKMMPALDSAADHLSEQLDPLIKAQSEAFDNSLASVQTASVAISRTIAIAPWARA